MADYEIQLRNAWHHFCDELKKAGDIPLRPTASSNPVDRAAAYRLLARNIGLALQFELDNNDPLHPELLHYFDPIRKQGGDNTDALYVGGPINGTDTHSGLAASAMIRTLGREICAVKGLSFPDENGLGSRFPTRVFVGVPAPRHGPKGPRTRAR